jgi:hypothetical protein
MLIYNDHVDNMVISNENDATSTCYILDINSHPRM